MSHLNYSSYKGFGEWAKSNLWYSQAVRVGDRIECSGQGGWDRETKEIDRDLPKQIEQAFANVEHTLKDAGGKGWREVYSVRSYHVPMNDEALELMTKGYKKYCPNHQPIWTAVGVQRLGLDDMRVEIEVVAHSPQPQ